MPSSAIVQKGTPVQIGFNSLAYTGYVVEDGAEAYGTQYEDEDEVTDTNNAVMTIMLSTPGIPFKARFLILDATGSMTPPAHGSAITITPPGGVSAAYFCQKGSKVTLSRKAAILDLDLIKYPDITHV